jgi:hypothetical protein
MNSKRDVYSIIYSFLVRLKLHRSFNVFFSYIKPTENVTGSTLPDRAVLFLAGMMHDDLVSISHWMRDFQPPGHEFELSDVHIRL